MKANSNVTKISDFDDDVEIKWKKVCDKYLMVKALDTMTPKSIPRSGIHMTKAVYELLDAIDQYSDAKEKHR